MCARKAGLPGSAPSPHRKIAQWLEEHEQEEEAMFEQYCSSLIVIEIACNQEGFLSPHRAEDMVRFVPVRSPQMQSTLLLEAVVL